MAANRQRAASTGATDADGAKRARILDAAEQQFADRGFDATPTARIAEEAGVPKGLVFYYFPRKADILRSLLNERLPTAPLCPPSAVVRRGDIAGSLLQLARRLALGDHDSVVLRSIIFREADTHPEVRHHIQALREGLLELTEAVVDAAAPHAIAPKRRRQAAHTYVAVMLDEANARRFDGVLPDLAGAAQIISSALAPQPAMTQPAKT